MKGHKPPQYFNKAMLRAWKGWTRGGQGSEQMDLWDVKVFFCIRYLAQ